MFWSRARTEAPMLRIGSRIGSHGLQIGLNDFPDSTVCRVAGDFGRRRLAPPQRLAETFQRQIETGTLLVTPARALAVAKEIDDGFRWVIDAHADAFDEMFLHTRPKHLVSEAHELKRRMIRAWPPVLWTNRHPHARGHGIRQFMKRQRRHQADNPLRHELGCFRERMVYVERCT